MVIFLLLYIQNTLQAVANNTTQYNDKMLEAFCNDVKQRETLNCQPSFNTQASGNPGYYNMPVNTLPGAQDYNTGMMNPQPNLIQPNVAQPNLIQPNVAQPGISQVSPQNKPTPQHTQITLSTTPIPTLKPSTDKKLSLVLNENPVAKTQLINFLEYNGVPPPWDQLLDFETTQHHQLPDPDNLFRKIRKQLLDFDKVKTCIVEALVVIEKYINRGKAYLAEDLKDLCRDKILLKNILKRLRTKPAYEFRSELFKRYADIKCKSTATQKSFFKLRDWLIKIKTLFATL